MPLWVLLAGRLQAGIVSMFGIIPVMIGRSGSPPMNETITSVPMRGIEVNAEVGPGPRGSDPDPGGTVFVADTDAIPVELHTDAAKFIGMDFFTSRARNSGGLQAVDPGLHAIKRPAGTPGHDLA